MPDCVAAADGQECGTSRRANAYIKPSNILFARKATPRSQIGPGTGAAPAPSARDKERGPVHPGTPEFMIPSSRDDSLSVTIFDIYSLGCVIFEMLTGRRGGGVEEAQVTADSVRERSRSPPSLEGVLWKMLRKRPGQRRKTWQIPTSVRPISPVQYGLLGVLFDEAIAATTGAVGPSGEPGWRSPHPDPDYERDGRRASIVQPTPQASAQANRNSPENPSATVPPERVSQAVSPFAPPHVPPAHGRTRGCAHLFGEDEEEIESPIPPRPCRPRHTRDGPAPAPLPTRAEPQPPCRGDCDGT